MPKLIPFPVVVDLLDDGPVLKLTIEYVKGKKKSNGCRRCIGMARTNCASIREAAQARGEKDCMARAGSHYILRAIKKSEMR